MQKLENYDLTVIYYTSNYLDDTNPYFLANTKKQLVKALDGLPLVVVSQKPLAVDDILMVGREDKTVNVCVGDIGRSHLNIYKQMLIACKTATTKYVATAEDDIFYSYEHFHTHEYYPPEDTFMFDMNKLSLFTWTKPPVFSFRHNRRVVNQVIAPRQLMIDSLEERFARVEQLLKEGRPLEKIIKYWGDFGRYEDHLGVTVRKVDDFMCTCSSIVLTHEYAYGYMFNHGKRKRLGDLRINEIPYWGRAEDMLKLFYKPENV